MLAGNFFQNRYTICFPELGSKKGFGVYGWARTIFINTYIFVYSAVEVYCPAFARRGGVEVAGWTVDRKIQVRFPPYPNCVWALWWQGGKRRLRASRCPCRGRLGTLKTPSCPWRWVPGSRSKFGKWTTVPSLYSWNIAECDVKPQPTNKNNFPAFKNTRNMVISFISHVSKTNAETVKRLYFTI